MQADKQRDWLIPQIPMPSCYHGKRFNHLSCMCMDIGKYLLNELKLNNDIQVLTKSSSTPINISPVIVTLTTTRLTGIRGPCISWCILLQKPVGHQVRKQRWMHITLYSLQPPSNTLLPTQTTKIEKMTTSDVILFNMIIVKFASSLLTCTEYHHSLTCSSPNHLHL